MELRGQHGSVIHPLDAVGDFQIRPPGFLLHHIDLALGLFAQTLAHPAVVQQPGGIQGGFVVVRVHQLDILGGNAKLLWLHANTLGGSGHRNLRGRAGRRQRIEQLGGNRCERGACRHADRLGWNGHPRCRKKKIRRLTHVLITHVRTDLRPVTGQGLPVLSLGHRHRELGSRSAMTRAQGCGQTVVERHFLNNSGAGMVDWPGAVGVHAFRPARRAGNNAGGKDNRRKFEEFDVWRIFHGIIRFISYIGCARCFLNRGFEGGI